MSMHCRGPATDPGQTDECNPAAIGLPINRSCFSHLSPCNGLSDVLRVLRSAIRSVLKAQGGTNVTNRTSAVLKSVLCQLIHSHCPEATDCQGITPVSHHFFQQCRRCRKERVFLPH